MTTYTFSDELMDYNDVLDNYDPILGLEVHVELNTASKMFCGCSTEFGAEPNTHTCPVCLGLPGGLPVVNYKGIESAIRIGLALNCDIAKWCRFARKNYFYPDMTKNFQTSQYDEPICFDGWVDLEVAGETFRIDIERAHMEEDAGKLLHVGGDTGRIQGANYSLVDYNRAGVPLIEIVTKPIFNTGRKAPQVAKAYVAYLRELVRSLGVSDVRMEQGSLRCDANVSLTKKGSQRLGTRTETKNVNSLRSIEQALHYEICRQGAILNNGGKVKQETRHFHEEDGSTSAGRSKEEAEDYRYFPEPDLLPVAPSRQWVEKLRAELPEAPVLRRKRLIREWGFTELEMRDVLGKDGALELIDQTVQQGCKPSAARKWWTTELGRIANEKGVELEELPISPTQVAKVQKLVDSKKINDKLAREVIEAVLSGEGEPEKIVSAKGLEIVSDDNALSVAVAEVIADNLEIAEKIRNGKVQAAGALIGSVMKKMQGKADASRVRELILEQLQ